MFVVIKPTACGTVFCRSPYEAALRISFVLKQNLFGSYLLYHHRNNKGNISSSFHTL